MLLKSSTSTARLHMHFLSPCASRGWLKHHFRAASRDKSDMTWFFPRFARQVNNNTVFPALCAVGEQLFFILVPVISFTCLQCVSCSLFAFSSGVRLRAASIRLCCACVFVFFTLFFGLSFLLYSTAFLLPVPRSAPRITIRSFPSPSSNVLASPIQMMLHTFVCLFFLLWIALSDLSFFSAFSITFVRSGYCCRPIGDFSY